MRRHLVGQVIATGWWWAVYGKFKRPPPLRCPIARRQGWQLRRISTLIFQLKKNSAERNMGLCRRLFVIFFFGGILSAALLGYLYGDPPDMKKQDYWGYGHSRSEVPKDDPLIRKFKVHVDENVVGDLKRRLESTRFAQLPDDLRSQADISVRALTEVVRYWKDHYDWRTQEAQLNEYAHFRVAVEGIQVHFLRAKPKAVDPKTKVFTLLMIHGWPGSFAEFVKTLPLLTDAGNGFSFEVICPSIPGYGFSEVPHKEGFSTADAARVFAKLMEHLGRKQFYVHGGTGGGARVAKQMALFYPDRVLGAHFTAVELQPGIFDALKLALKAFVATFVFNRRPPPIFTNHPLEGRQTQPLQETDYTLQETKPDIAGMAMLDSPTALAAYLLNAMLPRTAADVVWSGRQDPNMKLIQDGFLTNVMLYWVSDSITSNLKFYKENAGKVHYPKPSRARVSVPAGFSLLREDWVPTNLLSSEYENIVTVAECPKGERVASMYQPALLARHIREFVAAAEEKNKTRLYEGIPIDFPFTVIEPLSPKVTEPLKVAADISTTPKSPRERKRPNTQKQRFEPKPIEKQAPPQGSVVTRQESPEHTVPLQVTTAAHQEVKPVEAVGETTKPTKQTDSDHKRGDTGGTQTRPYDEQSDRIVTKALPTAKREGQVVQPTPKQSEKVTSEAKMPQTHSGLGQNRNQPQTPENAGKSASARQQSKVPETASKKTRSTAKPIEKATKQSERLAEENIQQGEKPGSKPAVQKAEQKTLPEASKNVKTPTKPTSQTTQASSQSSTAKPQQSTKPTQAAGKPQSTK